MVSRWPSERMRQPDVHSKRGGTRGGQDQFNWEDVKQDKHRDNYLGASVHANRGRWQKGKDLTWFNKGRQNVPASKSQIQSEIELAKLQEQDAMEVLLGFKKESDFAQITSQQLSKEEFAEATRRGDGGEYQDEGQNADKIMGVGFGEGGPAKQTYDSLGNVVQNEAFDTAAMVQSGAAAAVAAEAAAAAKISEPYVPAWSANLPTVSASGGGGGGGASADGAGSRSREAEEAEEDLRHQKHKSKKAKKDKKKAKKAAKKAKKAAKKVSRDRGGSSARGRSRDRSSSSRSRRQQQRQELDEKDKDQLEVEEEEEGVDTGGAGAEARDEKTGGPAGAEARIDVAAAPAPSRLQHDSARQRGVGRGGGTPDQGQDQDLRQHSGHATVHRRRAAPSWLAGYNQ
eukprot:gene20343-15454_t